MANAADIVASVVVCTFNRCQPLAQCLTALLAQDYPRERYEILVMDNNSTDGTAELVTGLARRRAEPMVRVIRVPAQGLSYARNRGIVEARGEYILFIDDDAVAAPDWMRMMVACFADPSVSALGGKVVLDFADKPPAWLTGRFRGWLSEYLPIADEPYEIEREPWPVGCSMGFRAALFATLRPWFDPVLGRKGLELAGGEETELFARITEAGGRIFIEPRALVRHVVTVERMQKDYFVRLNQEFGAGRVKALGRPGRMAWLLQLTRYTLEMLGNFLLYAGVLCVSFSDDRGFLRYLLFYRSRAKTGSLLLAPPTQYHAPGPRLGVILSGSRLDIDGLANGTQPRYHPR